LEGGGRLKDRRRKNLIKTKRGEERISLPIRVYLPKEKKFKIYKITWTTTSQRKRGKSLSATIKSRKKVARS